MKTNRIRISCIAAFTMSVVLVTAVADESRWWPVQTMPGAIVKLEDAKFDVGLRLSYEMTAQSVAGLAAKSVNEQVNDEMVWVSIGNIDQEDWVSRLTKNNPQIKVRQIAGLWELIDEYVKKGIIKGYILYKMDDSKGEIHQERRGINYSVNIATSLAGLFDCIIVDEKLEEGAKAHGLKMLMDVRNKTQEWCFNTYKDRFNRRMVCTQDPRNPNIRDLAIAQKAFTVYGYDELIPLVMQWLEPLSPVLGWNGGDEFTMTKMSSIWGHFQTATNWCANLPVLMAGTEKTVQSRVKNFDPRTIDFNDSQSGVSFMITDGDNVQWYEGNFFRSTDGKNFWGCPERGKIPFGWSCCFTHLSQLCPEAIDYAAETQSPNDSFIEMGGGYYYPDLFGVNRSDRWQLLALHARRTWELMKKNNVHIVGFNLSKLDSPDALKSYDIFAKQTDSLLGILVFQYDSYETGQGKIFWVKDRNGIEIPVISAGFSIWNHRNNIRYSGTPAKVAGDILQKFNNSKAADLPKYEWVITHAWSWFRKVDGFDINAEDMPQEKADLNGGVRGYVPVMWCAERLSSKNIRVVGPEEMIWRIRMRHNPQQTQKLIQDWPR